MASRSSVPTTGRAPLAESEVQSVEDGSLIDDVGPRGPPFASNLAPRGRLSLRDFHDHNFWHAFTDVFAKLLLAAEAGVPSDVPAIVGHRLTALPSWPCLERIFSQFRPIIVQQPDVFVRANTVYAGVTLNNDAAVFDAFLDVLEAQPAAGDPSPPDRDHAIFVTRGADAPPPRREPGRGPRGLRGPRLRGRRL